MAAQRGLGHVGTGDDLFVGGDGHARADGFVVDEAADLDGEIAQVLQADVAVGLGLGHRFLPGASIHPSAVLCQIVFSLYPASPSGATGRRWSSTIF